MPLPEPELAREAERVFAGCVKEFVSRERHGRGVDDATSGVDKRDDEYELKRIDDVVAELRGGYVEAEDEGESEAEDRGAAEDGVDADEEPCGEAPREPFGRCAHA